MHKIIYQFNGDLYQKLKNKFNNDKFKIYNKDNLEIKNMIIYYIDEFSPYNLQDIKGYKLGQNHRLLIKKKN